MAKVFEVSIYHRAEKLYGVGKTANERHSFIVGGFRGEVIDGLKDGEMVYTGVCASKDEAKRELISQLKTRGYTGILRVI